MTVAELRKALAALPDAASICYACGASILPIEQIDVVSATPEGDAYIATFDGKADNAIKVAVVS